MGFGFLVLRPLLLRCYLLLDFFSFFFSGHGGFFDCEWRQYQLHEARVTPRKTQE